MAVRKHESVTHIKVDAQPDARIFTFKLVSEPRTSFPDHYF